MSNYIQCSVRPAGRWLFSASGGRRDTNIFHPRQHRLYIRGTCRSACRDPFYGGKRRSRAARQERGATWQWLHLHIRVPGPSQAPPSPPTTVRRAFVLRAPTPSKTFWPGEFLEVQLQDDAPPDSEYALEPRTDAPSLRNLEPSQLWPQPGVASSVSAGNPHTKPVNRTSNA